VPHYAAFLRGMNVGGHRITNAQLTAAVAAEGLEDVATFRASGNVVFSSRLRSAGKLESLIEEGLERTLGYAVPTYVRSAEQVRAIATARPFSAALSKRLAGKPQVALLRKAPATDTRREVLKLAGADDALAIVGSELYWLPAGAISDSELDLKAIERALDAMTVRTTGTIAEIAARHFAD
jgi:uncharacterized protein (DUF1697 family)